MTTRNPVTESDRYCEQLLNHYRQCWSDESKILKFTKGPVGDLPPGFRVIRFAPNLKHRMWAYATVCMSEPKDVSPLELHFFARDSNDEIAELLLAMAHYHRTGKPLGWGHSVNFGRPWWPGSRCDRGLISLPYLDGPELEWLFLPDHKIRFLWVVPITQSEVNFKRAAGLEALESRFEEAKLDYLDPNRPSVV